MKSLDWRARRARPIARKWTPGRRMLLMMLRETSCFRFALHFTWPSDAATAVVCTDLAMARASLARRPWAPLPTSPETRKAPFFIASCATTWRPSHARLRTAPTAAACRASQRRVGKAEAGDRSQGLIVGSYVDFAL